MFLCRDSFSCQSMVGITIHCFFLFSWSKIIFFIFLPPQYIGFLDTHLHSQHNLETFEPLKNYWNWVFNTVTLMQFNDFDLEICNDLNFIIEILQILDIAFASIETGFREKFDFVLVVSSHLFTYIDSHEYILIFTFLL